MRTVVFVAPFLLEATLRFLEAVADLPGVALGVVSQDPFERLPERVRRKVAQHWRVNDALDPSGIVEGVEGIESRLGPVERLLGTLEQLQVPLAMARETLGLPGTTVEASRNFRDKSRMKDVLRAHGLPCARHRLAAGRADARAFAAEVGFPIVAKPPDGAGAKATLRVDDVPALEAAVAGASPERPVLLEEFVRGEEHSFDTVSIAGRPVWHSLSRYLPSPLHVLENPWIQWCVLVPREVDHPRYDDVRRVAFRALEALGMGTGVTHMEWFRRGDGSVCVSEVAARPPGAQFCSLISWANDFDFYAAWARLVVFDAFDPPERRYAAGAAYLRGQGSGRVARVEGLEDVRRELGPLVVEARLPEPGQGPTGTYEGEGYVILRHPRTEVVEEALMRLVSRVRVVLG
jgi:hypothetical protein